MLKRGINKALALGKHWGTKALWTPVYLRFQFRGHGSAWNIFTQMTPQERLLLYRLGLKQKPGAIFLEVGSYLGASACFLAAAASELEGQTKVYCVDTWQNDSMTEGLRDTWTDFQINTRPYSTMIKPYRGLSVEVAQSTHESVDLLFLDGDHSYEGCKGDVVAWLPHLKPGGVLVMHDYGWAEGVQRVVRELIMPRERERGHVLQNTYWTVL